MGELEDDREARGLIGEGCVFACVSEREERTKTEGE